MQDVAHRADVSQATVSFVLNGVPNTRITAETQRRVAEAAEALGYRPRAAGRPANMISQRVFGMLVDEIATSPFAAMSIEGLQEWAWKSDAIVEVAMSGGDPDYESAILRRWAQERIDGVVYASILTREIEPPKALFRHRAVMLNCHDPRERLASIVPAERRGGEAATQALLSAGHRRIAFIGGEPWMDASQQRHEGFQRAMAQHNVPIIDELVMEGNFLPSGGYEATRSLMSQTRRPDAIFCANDAMAVGCYEALKELGERVGQSIAVMGYDNQEISQHLSPALSTVELPHREMGRWCAEQLLGDDEIRLQQVRLECPIVLRQSHRLHSSDEH
jgi:LacI family transcriptional regulator